MDLWKAITIGAFAILMGSAAIEATMTNASSGPKRNTVMHFGASGGALLTTAITTSNMACTRVTTTNTMQIGYDLTAYASKPNQSATVHMQIVPPGTVIEDIWFRNEAETGTLAGDTIVYGLVLFEDDDYALGTSTIIGGLTVDENTAPGSLINVELNYPVNSTGGVMYWCAYDVTGAPAAGSAQFRGLVTLAFP